MRSAHPIATREAPHTGSADTRRLFATEAVTGGLPVHIAAKVLGHANLQTTQHYLAVFPDEVIRAASTRATSSSR